MRVFKTRGARGLPAARGADGDTVSYYVRVRRVYLGLWRWGVAGPTRAAGSWVLRALRRWRRCAHAARSVPAAAPAPRRPREMPESYIDGVIDLIRVILLILTAGGVCPVLGPRTSARWKLAYCTVPFGGAEG